MRHRFCISIAVAVGLVELAKAQVPVTITSDVPATIFQNANYAQYVKQVLTLQQQYAQLQQTFNTMNGLRSIGNLMNNDLLAQYLPADYQKAYQALKSGQAGSLSGISGTLNQIAASNQAQTCSSRYTDPAAVAACNQEWQTLSMNKYVGQAGYDQTASNIGKLQQFVNSITSTSDPKALQDLQGRIAVEQVKMQNEQMKLQTVAMMQKADEDLTRAHNSETTQQSLSAPMNTRWGANANNN